MKGKKILKVTNKNMRNVTRTFFLTKEEAESQRAIIGMRNIAYQVPHYELDDGSILWGWHSYPNAELHYSEHRNV